MKDISELSWAQQKKKEGTKYSLLTGRWSSYAHIYFSSQNLLALALLLVAMNTQGYMWGERWFKVHTVLHKASSLIL